MDIVQLAHLGIATIRASALCLELYALHDNRSPDRKEATWLSEFILEVATEYGGQLAVRSRVDEVLVENGHAQGGAPRTQGAPPPNSPQNARTRAQSEWVARAQATS